MRPLDAATMHVITTDAVILPLKLLTGPSMAKAPPAIFYFFLCPFVTFFFFWEAKPDLLSSTPERNNLLVETLRVAYLKVMSVKSLKVMSVKSLKVRGQLHI